MQKAQYGPNYTNNRKLQCNMSKLSNFLKFTGAYFRNYEKRSVWKVDPFRHQICTRTWQEEVATFYFPVISTRTDSLCFTSNLDYGSQRNTRKNKCLPTCIICLRILWKRNRKLQQSYCDLRRFPS